MTKAMTENEVQRNNINKLIELIKENPELKIIPMVDSEISGYDFSYYMGKWDEAEIDEIYHGDERIYFRSCDEEELTERIFDRLGSYAQIFAGDKNLEEKAKQELDNLEWEKAIVVKIGMP